ncbi:hypothetical protein R6Q57_006548 [Mikania cordata]
MRINRRRSKRLCSFDLQNLKLDLYEAGVSLVGVSLMTDISDFIFGHIENLYDKRRSMLNDEPQLCPYCSQPFSVVGDEFVRDPTRFGKESTTFGETFSGLFSQSKKGKASSKAVIDVEANIHIRTP